MTDSRLEPQALATPSGEPPRVILPGRTTVFADRARRFAALSAGHALGDWLAFLGHLTAAQQSALDNFPAVPLPDAPALTRCREHGMPPLPAQSWPRAPAWRAALAVIGEHLLPHAPPAAADTLRSLAAATPEAVEALADRVLRTELYGGQADRLPFVAAALQVYWTHLAASLGAAGVPALDVPGVCPCCGFLPVGSVVRAGGEVASLRYLHCALCNAEWNLVRVKCAACDANEKVSYRQIEGGDGAVRAETCDDCHAYLKIYYQEKSRDLDPVADDLATLALDILVDEAGYTRAGPNLLLVPGNATN